MQIWAVEVVVGCPGLLGMRRRAVHAREESSLSDCAGKKAAVLVAVLAAAVGLKWRGGGSDMGEDQIRSDDCRGSPTEGHGEERGCCASACHGEEAPRGDHGGHGGGCCGEGFRW